MGNIAKNAFPVLNMHCAGCANNVEKTVKKLPESLMLPSTLLQIH